MIINYYTIADAARILGVKPYRISYAHRVGLVGEPGWHHGRRAYQDGDIDRLRQYFNSKIRKF